MSEEENIRVYQPWSAPLLHFNLSVDKIKDLLEITDLETTIDETFNVADVEDIINENNGTIEIDEEITTRILHHELYTT